MSTGGSIAAPADAATHERARFGVHLSWNVASELVARGASLWVSFFGARVLAVEDYGRFTWALALAQTAWLAGDAALNSGYATRELARTRARGAADLFWQARLAAGVALSAGVAAAALCSPLPPATRSALAAAALYGVAYAAFPDWALRAIGDFRTLCLANAAYALLLAGTTLAWLPSHPRAAWAAGLWAASFLAAAAFAVPRLAGTGLLTARVRLTPAAWWPHARRSLVFSLGALAGIASVQLPLVVTGAIASAREAGLFGAAFRLVLVPIGAFSVLWWPLFPLLARHAPGSPAHRALIARAAALAAAVALPAWLAILVFAEPLLALLFGPDYAAAAPSLRAAAWALPVYVACGLFEQVALASGGEALRLRVYTVSAAVTAAVAGITVPVAGGVGAGLALAAGFACAALAWGTALRRALPWAAMLRALAPVAAAAVALAGAWLALARTPLPPLAALAVGGAAFAAATFGIELVRLPGAAEDA